MRKFSIYFGLMLILLFASCNKKRRECEKFVEKNLDNSFMEFKNLAIGIRSYNRKNFLNPFITEDYIAVLITFFDSSYIDSTRKNIGYRLNLNMETGKVLNDNYESINKYLPLSKKEKLDSVASCFFKYSIAYIAYLPSNDLLVALQEQEHSDLIRTKNVSRYEKKHKLSHIKQDWYQIIWE
ncbi:MAG: hypothetical protein DI598_06700 [Pseudopedobacter saltans]|uniref:Lipoprotein n=1 Tax=Pseudopedobacter saltans TaxID=151895 RepID=A0A2W5F841_9SPHI|nr:MAG: hypothetical protein DI598_06700 [Pseudopedobacter saltans]